MFKKIGEILKVIGSGLLVVLGYILLKDLFGKRKPHPDKKKIKAAKNKAMKNREKAEGLKSKIAASGDKRRKIRDQYSRRIPLLVMLLFLLPYSLFSKYIIYDQEDSVFRDYGTITNYARVLEIEKTEFLDNEKTMRSVIVYYSNSFVHLSNASAMQDDVIEQQTPGLFKRAKPYGIGCAVGVLVSYLISLFTGK